MDIKFAPLRVKAAGPDDDLEDGQFVGYASVFGNTDSYGDVVMPGAFAKSLAEWHEKGDTLPVLWGHDMHDPFANIGSVTKAEEDDRGLKITAQLDLENPKAAQVYRLLKGRRVSQMSFAYDVIEGAAVKSDAESVYELRELKLYEVSVVPIGANQETEILAVKAAAASLASGTKAGRAISAKNESELRKAHEAIGNVLAALGKDDDDQEKASGTGQDNAEEPEAAKAEDPRPNPSARALAELSLLALAEGEGGHL